MVNQINYRTVSEKEEEERMQEEAKDTIGSKQSISSCTSKVSCSGLSSNTKRCSGVDSPLNKATTFISLHENVSISLYYMVNIDSIITHLACRGYIVILDNVISEMKLTSTARRQYSSVLGE